MVAFFVAFFNVVMTVVAWLAVLCAYALGFAITLRFFKNNVGLAGLFHPFVSIPLSFLTIYLFGRWLC